MEKVTAIHTELGILRGRDCIYLDVVRQEDNSGDLIFTGEINGALVSAPLKEQEWFPYTLIFEKVLACFFCELDTYEAMAEGQTYDGGSFAEVQDSQWLKKLPIRGNWKDSYKHYRLFTYDVVYDILAPDYQLTISNKENE